MKQANCSQEAAVLEAAQSGNWQEPLREHAAGCAVCREAVATWRWMHELAGDSGGEGELPDAALVWRRAQLLEKLNEREAQAEKLREAMDGMQMALMVLVAVGLAGWSAWNWGAVQAAVAWLVASPSELWTAAYSVAGLEPVTFWSVASVLVLAAVFVAYPIVAEE
jgi:hypothetical protein